MNVSIRDGRMNSGKLKSRVKPRSEKLDGAFKFNEVQQTSHLKYMYLWALGVWTEWGNEILKQQQRSHFHHFLNLLSLN